MSKYVLKNKLMLIILFAILSLFFIDRDVYALPKISVGDGDYELVCKYNDGAELIITKKAVYLSSQSNNISSTSNNGIDFALLKEQYYLDNGEKKPKTNNIVTQGNNPGHCPLNLHLYRVPAALDSNDSSDEEVEDNESYNYYYATHSGRESEIGVYYIMGFIPIPIAEELKDNKTKLVSEEFFLKTNKKTTICDYKSKSTDYLGGNSISIYLFDNITIVETDNRTTPLWDVQKQCPLQSKTLYLNDPMPKSVGGSTSGNYEYNYARYSYSSSVKTCSERNEGRECSQYEFVGQRNGAPENKGNSDPCILLGNATVEILRDVISWLQVLVPALVIVLTGLDITKMVLSGNLDEELPKKKKLIIIRFIIMIFFFFAPIITRLVIDLLVESGVNIGDFECLIR